MRRFFYSAKHAKARSTLVVLSVLAFSVVAFTTGLMFTMPTDLLGATLVTRMIVWAIAGPSFLVSYALLLTM
jgi:hypothetical protein